MLKYVLNTKYVTKKMVTNIVAIILISPLQRINNKTNLTFIVDRILYCNKISNVNTAIRFNNLTHHSYS